MKIRYYIAIILLFLMFYSPMGFISDSRSEITVDHSIFAALLENYVHQGTVDYRGFKMEEAKLDQYLSVLENVDSKSLSKNEQFAFYINAYNAWTIKLVLSGYPGIKSIKDLHFLRNPWIKKICRIDGDVISLGDIEHNILRPRFGDPRVHFAINCASLSCPPLKSEPYSGNALDRQLDDVTQAFINNPKRNYLEGNTLFVSRIFKWFGKDFNRDIIGFFLIYANGHFKKELEAKAQKIKIKYLHYDWSLNGK